MNPDDFDALCEIVDALANKLARDRPKDETLALIAQRARKLYRQRVEGERGNGREQTQQI